eukprot:7398860-Alexandrium_andersonii.AAC.1
MPQWPSPSRSAPAPTRLTARRGSPRAPLTAAPSTMKKEDERLHARALEDPEVLRSVLESSTEFGRDIDVSGGSGDWRAPESSGESLKDPE